MTARTGSPSAVVAAALLMVGLGCSSAASAGNTGTNPSCQALSCEAALQAAGLQCGWVPDQCGATLNCTTVCGESATCGCNGAAANTCVQNCIPPINDPGSKYPRNPANLGEIPAGEIRELSGMVASRTYSNILWAHPDSGNGCQFVGIRYDPTAAVTPAILATFTLPRPHGLS